MTTFLERILATKREEIARLRAAGRIAEQTLAALPATRGFAERLTTGDRLAIISEIKQASPSKGLIAEDFRPIDTARAYESAGASAISVLTDETYFRGSMADLEAVRAVVDVPVLRKDFILDEAQIDEARQSGADAVLLICAALDPQRMAALSSYAKALRLDVLIEVHGLDELDDALAAEPSVLGVNNRDLRTFQVSLKTTEQVAQQVPADVPFIAESGIQTAADAQRMADCGAVGILVGESLMRLPTPVAQRQLVQALQATRRQAVEGRR